MFSDKIIDNNGVTSTLGKIALKRCLDIDIVKIWSGWYLSQQKKYERKSLVSMHGQANAVRRMKLST